MRYCIQQTFGLVTHTLTPHKKMERIYKFYGGVTINKNDNSNLEVLMIVIDGSIVVTVAGMVRHLWLIGMGVVTQRIVAPQTYILFPKIKQYNI